MTTNELEVQKAGLARAILGENDEAVIKKILMFFKKQKSSAALPGTTRREKLPKREIGFLEGKAKAIFHDDWKMTPEELGMI
jgi:hypothetical protein